MKKFVSLLLTVLMFATTLTVFAVPAMAASIEYSITYVFNWPEGKAGKYKNVPTYWGNSRSKTDLPIPSYVEDYTFEGWCEKSNLSDTPIKAIPPYTEGDKTFYGKWKKKGVSTITYHTDGGTFCDSRDIPVKQLSGNTFTADYYEGETTLLLDIKKYGYFFYGWYDNAEFKGNRITEIAKNETGNREFWAKFCNHSGMALIKIESNLKDEYEDGYYYFCERCGNCFSDANGEYFICNINDKDTIDAWKKNWCENHIAVYSYVDASLDGSDNVIQTDKYINVKDVKSVTANDTAWGTEYDDTWYVCSGSVTVNGRININGRVHLILRDGCTLTAQKGIHLAEGNTLSVYAQSDGENRGKLIATGHGGHAAIGGNNGYINDNTSADYGDPGGVDGENAGVLNVFGGEIRAQGNSSVGIGGGFGVKGVDGPRNYDGNGDISHATSGTNGGKGGFVNLYSGFVTATGSVGIGGGKGGDGGRSDESLFSEFKEVYIHEVGDGGNGGDGTTLCVFGGVLNVSSDANVAFGGGIGGKGGEKINIPQGFTCVSACPGSSGGDGGAGGMLTVKGGAVTFNSQRAMGGGFGGKAGVNGSIGGKKEGNPGNDGADVICSFAKNCVLKEGDSEAEAAEVSEYNGKMYFSVTTNQANAQGSTLSEGSLAIITGVAGLAVGFLTAMFIFKKKKPAVAGAAESDE